MPALGNVLLKVDNEQLTLTATDLEIELVSRIQIMADETGEITLPAKKLLDICKALSNEAEISLDFENDRA